MLKFRMARDNGGPLIVFGLSKVNIAKLQDGMPMKINLQQLGIEGEIYIYAGDTEESMTADLEAAGLLPAGAALNTEPN